MTRYYETTHANVHRGVYEIAQEATRLYEEARAKVASFIGASSPDEVVFTKNATEAINLVAYSWGRKNIGPGDVVVTTEIEHHANFVPWLQLREEKGTELRFLRLGDDGTLRSRQPRPGARRGQVAGGDRRLQRARALSRRYAQWPTPLTLPARWSWWTALSTSPHLPTDVLDLGADFVAFTGHKMLGPTGHRCPVGETRAARGDAAVPDRRRDDPRRAPRRVHHQRHPLEVRGRHSADRRGDRARRRQSTTCGGIGMGAVRAHEQALTSYAMKALKERYGDDIVIYGPPAPAQRAGIVSFSYKDIHAHDLSQVLDEVGRLRAGGPPLRQAADAVPRRRRHGAGVVLGVQRRGRCRCPRRRYWRRPTPFSAEKPSLGGAFGAVMPGLEDLYREIILDHYRNPRNRGELESPPAVRTEGFNPLCGDEIVVFLDVDGGVITDLKICRPRVLHLAVLGFDDVGWP